MFYIVKLEKTSLSDLNIGNEVVFGDLLADPIDNIAMMTGLTLFNYSYEHNIHILCSYLHTNIDTHVTH